ncbi:MAG TPA: Arc family DNA-binding protein [Thermoanaerobaculia bacterium]|nr:Arc family DNA-binding protein [Thermoanaerobaculia bacterium]
MAVLHIRNVPEDVYARIRELARSEGRSMNAQVVRLLSDTAKGVRTSLSLEEALAAARRIRQAGRPRRGPSGLSLLHAARRGRERR